MSVTLKFLGEQAALSPTTISLILNGKGVRVSEEKKKRVLELAKKYNYIPNSNAVSLVTKKTKTVGLIVPDISNTFFAEIAKKIEELLNKIGYNVILCNTNDFVEEEIKCANILYSKGVDVLIVCPTVETTENFEYLNKFIDSNRGVIAFDRFSDQMPCSSVVTDNYNSSIEAVEYLINCGHKKIGCITGPLNSYSAKRRFEGYIEALKRHNIPVKESLIKYGDYKFDSGYYQGKKLLKEDLTSAFVCNDLMAYGLYRAIKEKNLIVGKDISVIGFDDLLFSSMLDVPLTTMRQNIDAISEKVFEIFEKIINKNYEKEEIVLKASIIERNSVCKIN